MQQNYRKKNIEKVMDRIQARVAKVLSNKENFAPENCAYAAIIILADPNTTPGIEYYSNITDKWFAAEILERVTNERTAHAKAEETN